MPIFRATCKIGAREPHCGLEIEVEIEVEKGRMTAARPDRQHPITAGYACIKGMHATDYQNDPDRLLHPVCQCGCGLTVHMCNHISPCCACSTRQMA